MSQDDDGWRERLGIDFTIDLSDSDIDEERNGSSRKTGGRRDSQPLAKRNSGNSDELVAEEGERLESNDSFTQEEEELAHYLNDMSTTPPRTIRHRRQRERDAYCSQAKVAAKTIRASLKRKATAERFLSLPGFSDQGVREVPPERTRQQYRELKRSQDRQRSQDREYKQGTFEPLYSNVPNLAALNSLTAPDSDERCESLPPLSPLCKVDSRTRYRSVSSRKKGEDDDDQAECRKEPVAELPQDRVSYYEQLQRLVKLGSQDITFNQRQKSEEEVIYQQELFEILWLELQAWQTGMDSTSFDTQLIALRHQVLDVIDEVLNYKFDPNKHEKAGDIGVDKSVPDVNDVVAFSDLKIGGKTLPNTDTVDGVGMSRMVGG